MNLGILLILGIGVFGGILGAWGFQKIRVPQVIGYIAIGLLIGQSGLNIIGDVELPALRPFNYMALAMIGFLVGGELEGRIFKQYGKQFTGIMLGEGLGAFLVVGVVSGLLLWWVTGNPAASLAGGLVFGAISSATDPASTVDVLWEYRSKGMLTSGLISVVALDDALALTLYAIGTSLAGILVGGGVEVSELIRTLGVELLGSVALGVGAGFGLSILLTSGQNSDRSLTLMVGSLLLIAGISLAFHMDVILCAMSAGATLVNRAPRRSKALLHTLRAFAAPVYVMFFVLVGARLQMDAQPGWLWGLVVLYVVGRTVGKYAGTWIGARLSGSPKVLQQYLGMGLFAQGGVAVGLSMMASQHLASVQITGDLDLGTVVVSTVTATTLLVQIIGPASVKAAITRTGEIGRNVTEEDILRDLTVQDVLNPDPVKIPGSTLLHDVFEIIAGHDQLAFPVVDPSGACEGVISLESLKALFVEQEVWSWMIAEDVMVPIVDVVRADMPLAQALTTLEQLEAEETIVRDPETHQVTGTMGVRNAKRQVSTRLVQKQGV